MADIYVDSCFIISLIEGSVADRELLSSQLDGHIVYSSELARLEARVLAIRISNQTSLQKFEGFFSDCKMIDLSRMIFNQAALLRAQSKLKTPDALHLAAAIQSGCEEFWTDDKRLRSVAGQYIKVIGWIEIEKLASSQ